MGIWIDTGSVRYIGSQPWPFPKSCMMDFTVTAVDNCTERTRAKRDKEDVPVSLKKMRL